MATAAKSTPATTQKKTTQEQLAGIASFNDAALLMRETYGTELLNSVDVLGDGFVKVEKDVLVGVPMIIVDWKIMDTEDKMSFGEPWAIVRAVTSDDKKVVFVDGSTGIRDQLIQLTARTGQTGNLLASEGLRVSEYEYTDPEKPGSKPIPAKTYYIN